MSSVLQIRPGLHLDQELGQNTKIMEGALRYWQGIAFCSAGT
jgi:hypothetical protein